MSAPDLALAGSAQQKSSRLPSISDLREAKSVDPTQHPHTHTSPHLLVELVSQIRSNSFQGWSNPKPKPQTVLAPQLWSIRPQCLPSSAHTCGRVMPKLWPTSPQVGRTQPAIGGFRATPLRTSGQVCRPLDGPPPPTHFQIASAPGRVCVGGGDRHHHSYRAATSRPAKSQYPAC